MSHSTLLAAAQILKIIAGLSQLGFGMWLLFRRPTSGMQAAFAISFAANGIAYVFFNLAMPGQRSAGSLAVEGRAAFNWIATWAMLGFAALLIRAGRTKLALLTGAVAGALVLSADLLARGSSSLLNFGGIAIYPATALVLGMLPILFTRDSEVLGHGSVWLASALAINSVDHLGAELTDLHTSLILQLAALATVLLLWLVAGMTRDRRLSQPILLVMACMVLPFVAGILVREAAGSYVGVQRSGFIGVGRLVATALLTYAARRQKLFPATAVSLVAGAR